jgi:hypothetical protein
MTNQTGHHTPALQIHHPASFRDPAGFIFTVDGVVYRQVNRSYTRQYEQLIKSGLYQTLTQESLLISHTEVAGPAQTPDHHLTLLPEQLTRITYPAEWCPEQLKAAALLTLRIQQLAMTHGMCLKDATPFNIQFHKGRPILIDTLSFDLYNPTRPWIAYRQFCECFLFPLYIHQYARTGTAWVATAWPEGIPASLTARLLPLKSRWNTGAWLHVFLQARISSRETTAAPRSLSFSETKLARLIGHLESIVSRVSTSPAKPSAWSNYYSETALGQSYLEAKEQLYRQYLHQIRFTDALDLGCNEGRFAKILAETGASVMAVDSDWLCIETLYNKHLPNILPLCIDLANPTPASGFGNTERSSFTDRASSGLVIALALIHHLALRNNIPLPLIADYFSRLSNQYLLIEFVPLSDEKARELIARKETPTVGYDPEHFESAFNRHFRIERRERITGTDRVLYLLTKFDRT